jgi:SulP family sulfate permease
MYGVMGLTVFVDLIVAVGVGVFVANMLTIESLSQLQAQNVRAIGDADDSIPMTATEKSLIDRAQGQVLLFYLSGPMIFGVAKAIAREHRAAADAQVVIFDLQDVPKLGVTASLALENAMQEAREQDKTVWVVGANPRVRERLEKLGLRDWLDNQCWWESREEALAAALSLVEGPAVESLTSA